MCSVHLNCIDEDLSYIAECMGSVIKSEGVRCEVVVASPSEVFSITNVRQQADWLEIMMNHLSTERYHFVIEMFYGNFEALYI